MDKRSLDFLKQNNITHSFHTAKKINNKMLNYFDYFFAVDHIVLNELNKQFPKFKNKFVLLTAQFKDRNIIDPWLDIKYGRVVMQRPAKPFTPVRFRLQPPK